jgi:hypothetical protein
MSRMATRLDTTAFNEPTATHVIKCHAKEFVSFVLKMSQLDKQE